MPQVVQAKCPHCQSLLRIPGEWLNQPMRCKHCRHMIQARGKAPAAAARNGEAPIAPSAPLAEDPFSFDPYADSAATPRGRSRRKGNGWKLALLGGGVMVAAILVVVFAGPHLSGLIHRKDPAADKTKVVAHLDSKTDDKVVTKGDSASNQQTPAADKTELKPNNGGDDAPARDGDKEKDPPKKKILPKKTETKSKETPTVSAGAFPRRALLINVNNYLYLNSLHYGSVRQINGYPGSSTAALADQLTRPPMNLPATQITELSDGISHGSSKPHATLKPVIEAAITDFCDNSRAQDRIILLFAGHAIDIDKEPYLIPVEGNKEDAKTLIPLAWVYDKLAKCKARQKMLILDVCRFPPARGLELPTPGEMGEDFDAKLLNPPAGVQVWSSCIKGQQSIEFELGSVFLQSLCAAMQERLPGIADQNEPLPAEALLPKVNKRLKELLDPQKLEQVSRLTGTEAEGGADYDPNEPLPAKLALQPPAPPGGKMAGKAQIDGILAELSNLPLSRVSYSEVEGKSLPPFPAKALELYKTDYTTFKELQSKINADKDKYALRKAFFDMAAMMRKTSNLDTVKTLSNTGPISAKEKARYKQLQESPGQLIFDMENVLNEAVKAGENREGEVSPRWQANYDFGMARFKSRLILIYEYSNVLAQVRGDNLPEIDPKIHNGWRVGAAPKPQVRDVPKVKQYAKDIAKIWKKVIEDHPDTPWAVLAQRESLYALGLEWRPSRD